mgnify:CR=1 FL=1
MVLCVKPVNYEGNGCVIVQCLERYNDALARLLSKCGSHSHSASLLLTTAFAESFVSAYATIPAETDMAAAIVNDNAFFIESPPYLKFFLITLKSAEPRFESI